MINKFGLYIKQRQLNSKSVIKKLITNIYRSGLICDQDKFSQHNLEVTGRNYKYRKYFHLFWRLFHTFHITIALISYIKGNKDSPRYFMDAVQSKYYGGIKPFIYSIAIFLILIAVEIIKVFNFSDNNTYYWLKIFEKLKRYEILGSLRMWNQKEMQSLLYKIKFCVFVIPYITHLVMDLMFMFSLILVINVFNFPDIIIYGFPTVIIYVLHGYSVTNVGLNAGLCMFIVAQYSRIKFEAINKMTTNLAKNSFVINTKINQLIEEHNSICTQIWKYNIFWKKLIQGILFLMFPLNLLLLHQILFGKFGNHIMLLILLLTFLLCFGMVFYFAFFLSFITKESTKSFKLLIKLKVNIKNLTLNQSFKVYFLCIY